MSRGQMLHGQMSPWQLECVLHVHRNLPLKFRQNQLSNSWDITNIEFLWWWVVQSHFIVKPNLVLRLVWGFDNKTILAVPGYSLTTSPATTAKHKIATPKNGQGGLERDLLLRFFGALISTFRKYVFWFQRSIYEIHKLRWKKQKSGGGGRGEVRKKIAM